MDKQIHPVCFLYERVAKDVIDMAMGVEQQLYLELVVSNERLKRFAFLIIGASRIDDDRLFCFIE
jgi:hypothetical protein